MTPPKRKVLVLRKTPVKLRRRPLTLRSLWARIVDTVFPRAYAPLTAEERERSHRAFVAAEAARAQAARDRLSVSGQERGLEACIYALGPMPRPFLPPDLPPRSARPGEYATPVLPRGETQEEYEEYVAERAARLACYEAMLDRLRRTRRPFRYGGEDLDPDHVFPLNSDGTPWVYEPPEPPAQPPPAPPAPEPVTGNFGEDTARRAVSSPEVPSPPRPPPAKEAHRAPSPVPLTLPPHSGLKLVPAPRTGPPRTVHDRLLAAFVSTHVHAPDRWLPSASSAPVDGLWIHGDGSRTWVEVKTSRRAVGRDRLRGLSVPERFFGELREAMGDAYLVVRFQVGANGERLGVRITRPFEPRRGEPAQAVSPKAS